MTTTLVCGNGLDVLEQQPDNSIGLVLTDPPYGLTANSWEAKIDWERFWLAVSKKIKLNGAVLVFGNPPFSFDLVAPKTARKMYRYDWIWEKERGSNFQHANRQPMKVHEHVHVFYHTQPTYNPIKTDLDKVLVVKPRARAKKTDGLLESSASTYHTGGTYVGKFPTSIQVFGRDRPMVHATQKPLALCEYLVKTYSNIGDLVFDPFAGYATVALAAAKLGRDVVSVELSQEWHDKGKTRLQTNGVVVTEI